MEQQNPPSSPLPQQLAPAHYPTESINPKPDNKTHRIVNCDRTFKMSGWKVELGGFCRKMMGNSN